MSSISLYDQVCQRASRMTTRAYSTSFSLGIRCLAKEFRTPIYSIYGFVRFADEIVDTFHTHDKVALLQRFTEDTWRAIDEQISLNPILHSFQLTVNRYGIDHDLIRQFLTSMEMDLEQKRYDQAGYEHYILGSAEVVGLMCLRVFCQGNDAEYERLKPDAMKLGSAFQKINFLRDLQADYKTLGRTYFPGLNLDNFDEATKKKIEADIAEDFRQGFRGIRQLPRGARLGVYIAYRYYLALFHRIRQLPSAAVMQSRIRVRNRWKLAILGYSFLKHQLNRI
ncbi:MAG: phytoene/squalene synthase family protein [Cyclobacteriaceae bacterium]|nr:phytoene/squalene synthase family protein [Cyclobacteriaceae bacterium]